MLMTIMAALDAATGVTLDMTIGLAGNKGAKGNECQSWWCPMLIETRANVTLLFGCCKLPAPSRSITSNMVSSKDGGKTWSEIKELDNLGQAVYSRSGKLFMLVSGVGLNNSFGGGAAQYERIRSAQQQQLTPFPVPQEQDDFMPIWASDLPPLTPKQLEACQ